MAQLYLQTQNFKEAEKYITQAEKYAELTPDLDAKAFAKVKRTLLFKAQKDYPTAILHLKQAIRLYDQIGLMEDKIFMYNLMGDLLALSGNPEAKEVYGRLLILKDSIFKTETASKIADYRILYETEKKELSIKVLEAEANARQQQIIFIVVFLLLIVLAVLLFYNRRTLKLKTQMAEEKKRVQQDRFRVVIETEDKERKRIAQELHDGLGQMLSTVRLLVSDMDETNTEPKVVRSLKVLDTTIEEVRTISHSMMPIQLINSGLTAAIKELAEMINATNKISIKLITEIDLILDEGVSIAIYRTVQEIINNSIKYSEASQISLSIAQERKVLRVIITDNGKGFDTKRISESKGIGWSNIYSRMELIDGVVSIYSKMGEGTTVKLEIPLFETSMITITA